MIIQDIHTMDELLHFVSGLTQKHGLKLWYRGEENSELSLIPSIQRSQKRIDVERYITNDFYIRARQIMKNPPEKHNYAAWVSIMQHYGLPTRMLDWSQSPLIASFFATETYKVQPTLDAAYGFWFRPVSMNGRASDTAFIRLMRIPHRKCCCRPSSTITTIRRLLTASLPAALPTTTCVCMRSSQTSLYTILCRDSKISVMRIPYIRLLFHVSARNTSSTACGCSASRRDPFIRIWTTFPATYEIPTGFKKRGTL